MVEKLVTPANNVIDLLFYQASRKAGEPIAAARLCRHCGARLEEGEIEDDCSSILNWKIPRALKTPRKFYVE